MGDGAESSDASDAPPLDKTPVGRSDDVALVEALRRGHQGAFELLVDRHTPAMLRLAQSYLQSSHAAEDVVQETWMAVVTGIERFEGRSSLKTWIFGILVNRARTRLKGEGRTRPVSGLSEEAERYASRTIHPELFETTGRWTGHWAIPPAELPEDRVLGLEIRDTLNAMIDRLPARQRAVIVLRDVEGLSASETCQILDLSESNQRVLLHRARMQIRSDLGLLVSEGVAQL